MVVCQQLAGALQSGVDAGCFVRHQSTSQFANLKVHPCLYTAVPATLAPPDILVEYQSGLAGDGSPGAQPPLSLYYEF